VDKNTVTAVRQEMEGRGEIHHVEKRTDTRGRKQPARKAKAEPDVRSSDNARQDAGAGTNRAGVAARKPIKTLDEEQDPTRFKQLKLPIEPEAVEAST
jgi:hypothetical protein